MTVLWIILGVPALVLLCSWDELLMMALEAIQARRGDDKPARRRRIVRPSNSLPAGRERASQPFSVFRRPRPTDSDAAAGDGKPPHSSAIISRNCASVRRAP